MAESLSPTARLACDGLEKAVALQMLNAFDDAVDLLEADPSSAPCRRHSFGGGLWAIPVRDRHDDWLIVRNRTRPTATLSAFATSTLTRSPDLREDKQLA